MEGKNIIMNGIKNGNRQLTLSVSHFKHKQMGGKNLLSYAYKIGVSRIFFKYTK